MPRQSYTSVVDHGSDAAFTAWAKQLSDAIKACGMVQTADTGQVDWTTTKVRPAVGVFTFYEVYRWPDALFATRPIYMKVEYGTQTLSATTPGVRITVATGSNGAGTLTSPQTVVTSSNVTVATSQQTTYVCYKDGCFALMWGAKLGISASPQLMAIIDRSHDSSGQPNGNGFAFIYSGVARNQVTYSFLPVVANSTLGQPVLCLTNTLLPSQSSVSAVVNVFNWLCFTPDPGYLIGGFTYKNAEIAQYAEVDVALVGPTPRHYICLGQRFSTTLGWNVQDSTQAQDTPAILWGRLMATYPPDPLEVPMKGVPLAKPLLRQIGPGGAKKSGLLWPPAGSSQSWSSTSAGSEARMFAAYGPPQGDPEGSTPGDLYIDLDSGDVYEVQ